MPSNGTVIANPYGSLSVNGGTISGTTISNLKPGATIQLGSSAGEPRSYAEIDFRDVSIGAGNTLTIRAGAPGQSLLIVNQGTTVGHIQGVTLPRIHVHQTYAAGVDCSYWTGD